MLKHAVKEHPGLSSVEIEFRMQMVSQHKTEFERQLTEEFPIRNNGHVNFMNNKQDNNRCYNPKITIKKMKIIKKLTQKS